VRLVGVNKEFRTRVVIVTSKDNNLTKPHVKYLESWTVELAREVAIPWRMGLLRRSRPCLAASRMRWKSSWAP